MNRKKAAVFSIYYHNWNFGALLQSYALNQVLRNMGIEAEHIRFCYAEPASEKSRIRKRIRTVLTRHRISAHILERFFCIREHDIKNRWNFYHFHDREIHGSVCCYDAVTASKTNRRYDIFVTGSDQVWNPEFWSDRLLRAFGLTFVETDKKTLSYAASIGSEKAARGKEQLYREMLRSIDYISVREKAAKDFLQPLTEKNIEVVLDPTMLLNVDRWSFVTANRLVREKYIFSYFLEEKYPHSDLVTGLADRMGLPMVCISKKQNLYTRSDIDLQILDAGPREFLSYIKNAECIITNSFHGTVFSILFHKEFWVIKRYREQEKDAANHRVTELLNEFGLMDRLLEDTEVPDSERLHHKINYAHVETQLRELRKKSIDWLQYALDDGSCF